MTTPPLLPSQWRSCWTCCAWASSPAEAPCLGCGGELWERTGWTEMKRRESARDLVRRLGFRPLSEDRQLANLDEGVEAFEAPGPDTITCGDLLGLRRIPEEDDHAA